MYITTSRLLWFILAVLCLGAGITMPARAAVSPFAELPNKPQMVGDAELNEQTLAQKPDVYLQLISGMQQRGLYYAALAHLDAFEARWPNRPEAMLLRANAQRETGQTEAAKASYGKLLDGRLAARAYHGLGLIAVRAGNLDEGSTALNRAAALAPTDAGILGDQGYAFLMLGKIDEARLALFKAAELDEGNKRIGANLVMLLMLSGKIEQAHDLMQRYNLAPHAREEILARVAEVRTGQKNTKELTP
ncbi:MAG TPA: tetratricopeptide repeat protein [Gallionella sp.]|nr:tetratricopeptide repeat protein [Gallionella sp.]